MSIVPFTSDGDLRAPSEFASETPLNDNEWYSMKFESNISTSHTLTKPETLILARQNGFVSIVSSSFRVDLFSSDV
jgi:hypothetical protein